MRLLARHLERYIPGKPTILVVNKPGAGGMIAINELYNLRKPDGLTMSNINTGAIFAVAGGNERDQVRSAKILYVGQALDEAQVIYLKSSTPYTSLEAIKKANKEGKQPRMGAQSLDHTSSFVVKVAEQILGLDFHVIPGYPGTPEILLDIERGALDGRSQGTGSLLATKREWLKTGYIKPLLTSRLKRDNRLPSVPTIDELAPAGTKGLLSAPQGRAKYRSIACATAWSSAGSGERAARRVRRDDQRRTVLEGSRENRTRSRLDPRRGAQPRYRKHAAR